MAAVATGGCHGASERAVEHGVGKAVSSVEAECSREFFRKGRGWEREDGAVASGESLSVHQYTLMSALPLSLKIVFHHRIMRRANGDDEAYFHRRLLTPCQLVLQIGSYKHHCRF